MIATRNLEHDWKRSLSTVIVLSLVGLLIFQQFGSILGRWNSMGAIERQFRADLVIKGKNPPGRITRPINAPLPAGAENLLLTHPSIASIEPYRGVLDRIMFGPRTDVRPPGIMVVDPAETPILYPNSFPDDLLPLLHTEGDAIANVAFAKRFDLKVGDTLLYQDNPIRFVAFVDSLAEFGSLVILSHNTAMLVGKYDTSATIGGMSISTRPNPSYFLKLKDDADPEIVAGELRGLFKGKSIEVLTPEELVTAYSFGLLFGESSDRSFLITAVFAILISLLIAVQTMRGAVLSHSEEYGALQALGVGGLDLRLIAIETAFWLGLLSTAVAISGAFVMQSFLLSTGALFAISLQLIFVVSSLLMTIALFAGLVASNAVTRIQPEALLR